MSSIQLRTLNHIEEDRQFEGVKGFRTNNLTFGFWIKRFGQRAERSPAAASILGPTFRIILEQQLVDPVDNIRIIDPDVGARKIFVAAFGRDAAGYCTDQSVLYSSGIRKRIISFNYGCRKNVPKAIKFYKIIGIPSLWLILLWPQFLRVISNFGMFQQIKVEKTHAATW